MSVITVTKNNFESEIANSQIPVLVDFYADWCGPCRMVSPVVEEIANEKADIRVAKINVDEQPELAQAFNVSVIPTLVVMRDGKLANKGVGYMDKGQILALLGGAV